MNQIIKKKLANMLDKDYKNITKQDFLNQNYCPKCGFELNNKGNCFNCGYKKI